MLSYEKLEKVGVFIVNRRRSFYNFNIARPSCLGNPFIIGRDGSREEVILKYREWLWSRIREKGPAYQALLRIYKFWRDRGSVSLACFCFPMACHGQVIGSALVWMREQAE